MMPNLNWIPERYPQAGGMAAEGFIQLLGQPSLSLIELLVRETTQNSWDARATKRNVEMEFKYLLLEEDSRELRNFKDNLFKNRPSPKQFTSLHKTLLKRSIPLLIIRDTNTAGLGGVTRADVRTELGAFNRYRRFLLNIGEQHHPEFGGGAYGYGRSICFRASTCRTSIIYTRTSDDIEEAESRFVIVSYGPEFETGQKRYNGRHWWTTAGSEGIPATGRQADDLAKSIGLRPYEEHERGTTVAVIDPELDMTGDEICQSLSLSILYHLWPKYANVDGKKPSMSFKVMNGSLEVPVLKPESHPVLKNYVSALAFIKKVSLGVPTHEPPLGMKHHAVLTRSDAKIGPNTFYGDLVEFVYPRPLVAPVAEDPSEADETSVLTDLRQKFESLSHHVAIMRTPELVVTYIEVTPQISDDVSIGGVFRSADGDTNERLRKSEPPAHDNWNELCSDKDAKKVARRVLKKIKDTFHHRPEEGPSDRRDGDNKGALAIGGAIGELIWSEVGNAPGGTLSPVGDGTRGGRPGGGHRKKTAIDIEPPVMVGAQESMLTVSWRVSIGPSTGKSSYSIQVKLLTGDGDRLEVVDPNIELPRITSVTRTSNPMVTTKLNVISHDVTPVAGGEIIQVEVCFERGTVPTITFEEVK